MLNCKFCGREARSYVQLGDDVTYRHGEGDECSQEKWDAHLARIICYAFSVPPNALVHMANRATAQSLQEEAMQQGLAHIEVILNESGEETLVH
jgi:hypothetical protein